jgi:hypothetical protein
MNIPAKFGIITIAMEVAEYGGPAVHEKPRRAHFQASKPVSLHAVGRDTVLITKKHYFAS